MSTAVSCPAYRQGIPQLEDLVRREALAQYLAGQEEAALDFLAVASAMAAEVTA